MKFSASSIACYQDCGKKFEFRYIDRVKVVGEDAAHLVNGSAGHDILDKLKCERMGIQHSQNKLDAAPVVSLMASAWKAKYVNDNLTYLNSEFRFETTIGKIPIIGYIDGLARDGFGNSVIVEHKFTSSKIEIGAPFWDRLHLNTQVYMYVLACREMGIDVDYVLYDVIRLPFIKRLMKTKNLEYYKRDCKGGKKGELKAGQREHDETDEEMHERLQQYIIDNIDDLLVRHKIYVTADDLAAFEKVFKDCVKGIRAGIFPTNPNACVKGRFNCDYRPICGGLVEKTNKEYYKIGTR